MALNQFKPGQVLCFRFTIGSGFHCHCVGEFVAVDRGLVVVKPTGVESPDWFDQRELKPTYRLRASNVYLWGKGVEDRWPHCWWFEDTKTPLKP
jgi:hypothetical protein